MKNQHPTIHKHWQAIRNFIELLHDISGVLSTTQKSSNIVTSQSALGHHQIHTCTTLPRWIPANCQNFLDKISKKFICYSAIKGTKEDKKLQKEK